MGIILIISVIMDINTLSPIVIILIIILLYSPTYIYSTINNNNIYNYCNNTESTE